MTQGSTCTGTQHGSVSPRLTRVEKRLGDQPLVFLKELLYICMLIDMILHASVTVNIVVVNNADSYVKSSAHRNCCHSNCSESLPQKMSLLLAFLDI